MPVQRSTTTTLRASLYQEAAAIVEAEYASDLALDDVARRVATSRRQLQRAYSEVGQTSFREQLTRVRMERAAERLRHGGLTVREVARSVGYRQPAQFAKAFRRHHGVVPSEYRTSERRFARPQADVPRRGAAGHVRGLTALVPFVAAKP